MVLAWLRVVMQVFVSPCSKEGSGWVWIWWALGEQKRASQCCASQTLSLFSGALLPFPRGLGLCSAMKLVSLFPVSGLVPELSCPLFGISATFPKFRLPSWRKRDQLWVSSLEFKDVLSPSKERFILTWAFTTKIYSRPMAGLSPTHFIFFLTSFAVWETIWFWGLTQGALKRIFLFKLCKSGVGSASFIGISFILVVKILLAKWFRLGLCFKEMDRNDGVELGWSLAEKWNPGICHKWMDPGCLRLSNTYICVASSYAL